VPEDDVAVRKQTGLIDAAARRGAPRARVPAAEERVGTSAIPLDPYRSIVFPNRLREQRRLHGFSALLGLSAALPAIPYIRLSKIERGEVVARADELQAIAETLGISAVDLLIDIDDPAFDMARWVAQRGQQLDFDAPSEELAVLLAAAFRKNRQADRDLPLAVLESAYGLPPVIVSRIENAVKTPDRWNAATMRAICAAMDVADFETLEQTIRTSHAAGALDPWIARLPGEESRRRRTADRVAELRKLLEAGAPPAIAAPIIPAQAMLPVLGAPLADGLIAAIPANATVCAPPAAGPASFGLRMCRATLGAGMPASAVLVVDPEVFPAPGGLAVLREGEAFRVVSLGVDRNGAMTGYSAQPDKQIAIDALDPASVLAVIAAYFP
jgi:transcriptional regulator with XRE-family HTH domain